MPDVWTLDSNTVSSRPVNSTHAVVCTEFTHARRTPDRARWQFPGLASEDRDVVVHFAAAWISADDTRAAWRDSEIRILSKRRSSRCESTAQTAKSACDSTGDERRFVAWYIPSGHWTFSVEVRSYAWTLEDVASWKIMLTNPLSVSQNAYYTILQNAERSESPDSPSQWLWSYVSRSKLSVQGLLSSLSPAQSDCERTAISAQERAKCPPEGSAEKCSWAPSPSGGAETPTPPSLSQVRPCSLGLFDRTRAEMIRRQGPVSDFVTVQVSPRKDFKHCTPPLITWLSDVASTLPPERSVRITWGDSDALAHFRAHGVVWCNTQGALLRSLQATQDDFLQWPIPPTAAPGIPLNQTGDSASGDLLVCIVFDTVRSSAESHPVFVSKPTSICPPRIIWSSAPGIGVVVQVSPSMLSRFVTQSWNQKAWQEQSNPVLFCETSAQRVLNSDFEEMQQQNLSSAGVGPSDYMSTSNFARIVARSEIQLGDTAVVIGLCWAVIFFAYVLSHLTQSKSKHNHRLRALSDAFVFSYVLLMGQVLRSQQCFYWTGVSVLVQLCLLGCSAASVLVCKRDVHFEMPTADWFDRLQMVAIFNTIVLCSLWYIS
jgi:hypothetical protein